MTRIAPTPSQPAPSRSRSGQLYTRQPHPAGRSTRLRPLLARFALATTAAAVLAATPVAPAQAADVLVLRPGERIDPAAIANILGAGPARATSSRLPPGTRTRSIRFNDDAATSGGAGALATPVAMNSVNSSMIGDGRVPTTLSLPVPFAFNSAVLLPDARMHLDAVAEGIEMLPAERRVIIEGHTDSAGPDDYNRQLSERRAAAVRYYLVMERGISAHRLTTVGLGESTPLDSVHPRAGINRRVQFRGG